MHIIFPPRTEVEPMAAEYDSPGLPGKVTKWSPFVGINYAMVVVVPDRSAVELGQW